MKFKNTIIAGAALLSVFALASTNVQAQAAVASTNNFSLSAKAYLQGATNDNGRDTTKVIAQQSITTKQLLAWLATDESAAGHIGFNIFSNGATLNIIITNGSTFAVQVLDKHGLLLADVSDLITFTQKTNVLVSSKVNDTTGFTDSATKQISLATFTFDDSSVLIGGVGLKFTLTGLEQVTINDSHPSHTGVIKQTISGQISDATGAGTFHGAPIIVTGDLKFSERATLQEAP